MNPHGLFGSQSGAFQAPGGVGRGAGLFSFGQPSAFTQPATQGSLFAPAIGQIGGTDSGISNAFSSMVASGSQAPLFGQGNTFTASALSQQQGGFATSGFLQHTFGQSSRFPAPAATSGPPAQTHSMMHRSSDFNSQFSFKPPDAVLFKPIFSGSPEPASQQAVPVSESLSSASTSTSGMETTTTGVFSKGPVGFKFSQPAAASRAGLTSKDNQGATGSSMEFTFSQPAAPLGGAVSQATTVPSSPSSFSFTASTLQPQSPPSLFGIGFTQAPSFRDLKTTPELEVSGPGRGTDADVKQEEPDREGVFGAPAKGTKRKEELVEIGKVSPGESMQANVDSTGHPPKRPLLRNRGPASGLFRNAMSNMLKSAAKSATPGVKREIHKKQELQPEWTEIERINPEPPASTSNIPPTASTRAQTSNREPEKEEPSVVLESKSVTPSRRSQRTESTDSLSGTSPSDALVIQCKNIPSALNRKDILEKHFCRFGRVQRVLCRPQKDLAIVHFQDHASAAKAKKRGKILHRNEISIFWQRKKQSPREKGTAPPTQAVEIESMEPKTLDFVSSPSRMPTSRASVPAAAFVSHTKGSQLKNPMVSKTLHFDAEPPQHESSPEPQSLDRPSSSLPSSLLHLMGQVAETAEEKYRLLEQRDKILRQERPRRTDLDLSKVFVGTCPDMCPEKERYMRETRNQLSSFEVIANTEKVDHAAAIKEYSRSSADQEEPLPHELRPLSVLSMTMDYLVTQIMDQGEDNYRDWYDFVWNRTRGIRKDITQQHLCDSQTVSLIEKCARFHIHCAHHLCQEPMMSFDAKINNENLTKCLQSLKEMYQDLATRNIYCHQEAEFRQYSVLLKLNDGDILREVQQFRTEVRNSAEVKFAVQAFAALNSNNFVRFFKLVKGATYLSSCILHRYFSQVRRKALQTLNNAYTMTSRSSTNFPVDDLVRMLMFRNLAEASDYVQQYGLSVCDGMVELSRTAWQDPDLPLPPKRSLAIMSKRTVLIGQVVNGGLLPSTPQHMPVCSFDSQNRYRGDGLLGEPLPSGYRPAPAIVSVAAPALTIKPLMELELKPPPKYKSLLDILSFTNLPSPVSAEEPPVPPTVPDDNVTTYQPVMKPPSPPPKPAPIYTEQDLELVLDSVVEEVVQAECSKAAAAAAKYAAAALSVGNSQVELLLSEVLQHMLRELSSSEIQVEQKRVAEEKRKIEEAKRKQEHEAFLNKCSISVCSEICKEVLTECLLDVATSEIQKAKEQKAECVARSSEDVCLVLVEESLQEELSELAQEILEVELQRIRKFLKRWRDVVLVRRQLKRQMRDFPAAPCCVDPKFKVKALAPSAPNTPSLDQLAQGVVNLGHAGNLSVSCTRILKTRQEVFHNMKVQYYYQQLLNETVWKPLDLPTLVAASVHSQEDRIFWKAVLLLPSNQESDISIADRILTDWVETKFSGNCGEKLDDPDCEGHLQTLCINSGLRSLGDRACNVHVCVKATRGPLSEGGQSMLEEQRGLLGTSGLLTLLPTMPDPGEEDVTLLSALLQLRQVQQSSSHPPAPPLPLAVLVPEKAGRPVCDLRLQEDLKLRKLIEDGLISEYVFIHIPETTNDLEGSKQVSRAVKWLVARRPSQPPLVSQTLVQFVEAGLCREFSSRLYKDRLERQNAGLPSQHPVPIIQLYNSVLGFLAQALSNQSLIGFSWPVAEFSVPKCQDLLPHLDWNSPDHLAWLGLAVLSLQIPQWNLPSHSASWPQICASISHYMSQIPLSSHSQPVLASQLENLLERTRSACCLAEREDEKEDEEGKTGPSFDEVPWDEIVALCIDHRLKDWRPPEGPVCRDAISDDGEIMVYFLKDSLRGFLPPSCWMEAEMQTHRDKRQKRDNLSLSQYNGQYCPSPRQKLFHSLVEAHDLPPTVPLDITQTPSPQDLLPHKVLTAIQEEKALSRRFEEQLQHWLQEDPLDTFSMPIFLPSTLLSVPEIMVPGLKTSASYANAGAEGDAGAHRNRSHTWWNGTASVTQQLRDLEHMIKANQEEELACGFQLQSILDIVED